MFVISAFIAGLSFGIGLLVPGMVNPAKVLGFLDLAGRRLPSSWPAQSRWVQSRSGLQSDETYHFWAHRFSCQRRRVLIFVLLEEVSYLARGGD